MERVVDQADGVEVFENDIQRYLIMFCEENNIQDLQDLRNISQNVWNGCLLYINRHVFKGTDRLKTKKYIFNNNIPSNCNAYDISKVDTVCDYYIYLCNLYDKEVSIIGFSKLTGITQDTIYGWANDTRKLSQAGSEIYKKLSLEREESLSSKLVTGNKNPVGILGVLNRHYQWNAPGFGREQAKNTALSAAELPRLGNKNSENVQIAQIEDKQE